MSVKQSAIAWELEIDPFDKLVLLAFADHADSDGNNVFPGNEELCAKTGLTQPTITKKVKKFIEEGILTPTSSATPGRGRMRMFILDLSNLPRRQYFIDKEAKKQRRKVEAPSTFPNNSGHRHQPEKVKPVSTFPIAQATNEKVKPDTEKVKPDTEKVKPDTEKVKPDTVLHDKERARLTVNRTVNRTVKGEAPPLGDENLEAVLEMATASDATRGATPEQSQAIAPEQSLGEAATTAKCDAPPLTPVAEPEGPENNGLPRMDFAAYEETCEAVQAALRKNFPGLGPLSGRISELTLMVMELKAPAAYVAAWPQWFRARYPGKIANHFAFGDTFAELADEGLAPDAWLNGSIGTRFLAKVMGYTTTSPVPAKTSHHVQALGHWLDDQVGLKTVDDWREQGYKPEEFIKFWKEQFPNLNALPTPDSITKYWVMFMAWTRKKTAAIQLTAQAAPIPDWYKGVTLE